MRISQLAKHPLTITFLAGCALFVAVLLTTPYLIDMGRERWMNAHEQGEAWVENVDFNPFTRRLAMDNLVVETESGRIFHIPYASAKFSWKQLFVKHLYFDEIVIRDTSLVVDRFEDVGFRVGGLILRELVGAADESAAPTWEVGIDHFELTDSRVEYQTPEITATYFIDRYTLMGLESWDNKSTVTFELQGRIDDSPVHIKTKVVPFDTERSWDGTLKLRNGSLALLSKARALALPMTGSIDIDTKLQATLQRDGTLQLAVEGNVGLQQLAIADDGKNISQAELTWQGKLSGKKLPNQGITLNIAGRLAGKDLVVALPVQGLQVGLADFILQEETELEQHQDGTLLLGAEGTLGIQKLAMEYDHRTLSEEELDWQGKLSARMPPQNVIALQADGRLHGKGLDVALPEQGLQVQLAGFNLRSNSALAQQDDTMNVSLTAELAGENVSLTDKERKLTLLEANSFAVQGIDISDLNEIVISKIALQQPLFVARQPRNNSDEKKSPPLLHANGIEISDTAIMDLQNLSINDLLLQDSQFFFARRKDGSWQQIDALAGQPASGEPQPGPDRTETTTKPVELFLQNLRITGNSTVRFEDEKPLRPYRTTFLINEFQVTDINTANPDKPATVKLDGMVGQYGTAKFNGHLLLFAKPLSFDMTGNIKALDLPPLSSYTGQTIGYVLTSGQMDAEIKTKVDKGELVGENDLLLRNLEIKPEDPAKMEELGKQLGVPLETGLAMLRNKKDEIELNMPLQGNIANPEFDFQDAINQALAKALKVGAVSYLKFALQPFGAYLAIAQVMGKAGKEITKVRLDPIEFRAGEKELDEAGSQYLEKVAGILNDRPKLRVEICGKAVEADRIALRDKQIALLEKQKELKKNDKNKEEAEAEAPEIVVPDMQIEALADERAQLVKEDLSDRYGVDHTRMYICLPEIVAAPESRPLVELLID